MIFVPNMLKNHGFWPFLTPFRPKIDHFLKHILLVMNCMSSFHANKVQNLPCRCPGDFLRVVWRTETKFVHIKSSQICSTEPIFEIFVGSCSYDRFRAILAHCARKVFFTITKNGLQRCLYT